MSKGERFSLLVVITLLASAAYINYWSRPIIHTQDSGIGDSAMAQLAKIEKGMSEEAVDNLFSGINPLTTPTDTTITVSGEVLSSRCTKTKMYLLPGKENDGVYITVYFDKNNIVLAKTIGKACI